jgi:hypothetical protein
MRRFAAVALLAFAMACGDDDNPNGPTPPNNTGPIVFTAQLSPANEVPPVSNAESSGTGTATITFNVQRDAANGNVTGGGTVNFQANLSGFPAGVVMRAAHIHPGATGVNGSPLVDTGLSPATAITLTNGSGTLSINNINISQADATAIVANPAGFYFNVHSNGNPGGFARGQLVRQ